MIISIPKLFFQIYMLGETKGAGIIGYPHAKKKNVNLQELTPYREINHVDPGPQCKT